MYGSTGHVIARFVPLVDIATNNSSSSDHVTQFHELASADDLSVQVVPLVEVAVPVADTAMKEDVLGDHATAFHAFADMVRLVHVVPSVDVAQILVPTAANSPRDGDHATLK